MYRGYYISANALLNQQRTIDIISNNIANANTAGFKADENVETTFAKKLIEIQGSTKNGGSIEYRTTEKTATDLSQGSFEFTESKLDLALEGDMYFNVSGKDSQKRLTRNGQLSIDDEGYLCAGNSGRLLSSEGEIKVGSSDFSVNESGILTTADGRTYNLMLTYVSPDSDVVKKGDNLFEADAGVNPPEDNEYKVIQGAYERSNVDVAKALTDALKAQRVLEACSQALKQIDSINQRTASEIGKL